MSCERSVLRIGSGTVRRRVLAFVLGVLVMLPGGPSRANGPGPVASKTADGFLAVAAILPETHAEFMEKWNTARRNSPQLSTQSEIDAGSTVLFVALAGGLAVVGGKATLNCNIAIITPSGERQEVMDGRCLEGALNGPGTDVYLVTSFEFKLRAEDAGKRVGIEATITDANSGRSVPLSISVGIVTKGEATE